jgi:hypothetical protein
MTTGRAGDGGRRASARRIGGIRVIITSVNRDRGSGLVPRDSLA